MKKNGTWIRIPGRLSIQTMTDDREKTRIKRRNIHEKISRGLIGSHSLAGAGGMPDKAGQASFRRLPHGLDRMNLIRPQEQQALRIIVQDSILRHHFMRCRNSQDRLRKIEITRDRLIFLIQPAGKKLLVQFCITSCAARTSFFHLSARQ